MANAFAAGASGASWDNLTETAYNRRADFALRSRPVWMQTVDTQAKNQAMPGDIVVFTIHKDLSALATTPLTETVDPDSVAPQAPTRVSVTLNEYGNSTQYTRRLEELAFTQPDRELSVIVGRNMVDTIDSLIQTTADTSTNVLTKEGGVLKGGADSTVGSVTTTDTMNKAYVAAAVTKLRDDKVEPVDATNYFAIAHPDVLYDVMAESSANSWVSPHIQGGDPGAFYNGEVGTLAGARFLESIRVTTATDGTSLAKVYRSYFFGQQAIAEGVAVDPSIVIGNVVDKLKRLQPVGWYGLLGWALYRPQALRKVHSASSVGTLK